MARDVRTGSTRGFNIVSISLGVILGFSFALFTCKSYQSNKSLVIQSYLELEKTVVERTAANAELWFRARMNDATVEQIEQEIFRYFVEPIAVLRSGDAWIYNRDYVIYDKSSDFPEKYREKSIDRIFREQAVLGAAHYDGIVAGVLNASDGVDWYVWLPEKGREWTAWKSFKVGDQTWTLGLSTPEDEIFEYYGIRKYAWVVFSFFLAYAVLYSTGIIVLSGWYKRNLRLSAKLDSAVRRLNAANARLVELDAVKNDFIASVAHELRSPLSIVMGLAQLNADALDHPIEEYKRDFASIQAAALNMNSSISNLLGLSLLAQTEMSLKYSKLDIRSFLSTLAEYHRVLLARVGVNIATRIPKEIPELWTDRTRVEEILNNLISNAAKFTPVQEGRIELSVEFSGDKAMVSVSDNGAGIDPENLELIFERYPKARGGGAPRSGLGLYYSRLLAQRLGGSLSAQSPGVGKGSTFTLTLPLGVRTLAPGDEMADDGAAYAPAPAAFVRPSAAGWFEVSITEENLQDEFSPKKGLILVVSGDAALRGLILRFLRKAGFLNFAEAGDGHAALKILDEYSVNLVICDLDMPGSDGSDLHDAVTDNPRFNLIPFLFLSSRDDPLRSMERREHGAADFLKKPVPERELVSAATSSVAKHMNILKLSLVDDLTKIMNRRGLFLCFERMCRNCADSDIALVMFDLDHFKRVNDSYGHLAGDAVLAAVSAEALKDVRATDTVARYGGEEFVIVLSGASQESAAAVAEKLRGRIERLEIPFGGRILRVTASFGVASLRTLPTSDRQGAPASAAGMSPIKKGVALLEAADRALYAAKSTTCPTCGFASMKEELFAQGDCPQCGERAMAGRNRVALSKPDGDYPSAPVGGSETGDTA